MASRVVIDGVEYTPEVPAGAQQSIGIGITTRNRWDVVKFSLERIRRHSPGAQIVIVDDASDETQPSDLLDAGETLFRFDENVGIARAKNKCLELLSEHEHIFLFDDDAYPLVDRWWDAYVDSPEPHLMYIFEDLAGPQKLNDIKRIYEDDEHVAYTGPRGVMLYAHRSVLETVGGMDTIYGKWGYEHGDWSNRIHNAGLTTSRFMDVANSSSLIFSMDEHEQIPRSVDKAERIAMVKRNVTLYYERWDSSEYHEFREQENVVLTCLFNTRPDPQRPSSSRPGVGTLDTLLTSLSNETVVIMSDEQLMATPAWADTHYTEHSTGGVYNLYVQRWISYWHWLRENPQVAYLWMVDGTDVELLRDPWKMKPGTLYVGHEPMVIRGSSWMAKNTSPKMIKFLAENQEEILLNAGLIGGDRKTVLEFLHDMIKMYFDNATLTFLGKDKDVTDTVNDMGMLNIICRSEKWASRLNYGPLVNTVFKRNERTDYSIWRHK